MSQIEALVRKLAGMVGQANQRVSILEQAVTALSARPRTITEEIDAIPGRRIEFDFNGQIEFDVTDAAQRGNPITIQVSQDGPFIMTHYPLVMWAPSAPDNATNFGQWSPVSTFPMPTQQVAPSIIDISYEIVDGGNNRAFQNGPRGLLLSRPDNIVPLPVPTLFAPNATIQFFPTYNAIDFNGGTPATAGILQVDLIGYRIVNL